MAVAELWLAGAEVVWCLFFAGCNLNTPLGYRTSWVGQKIKSRAERRKEGEGNEGKWDRGKRKKRRWGSEKRWFKEKMEKQNNRGNNQCELMSHWFYNIYCENIIERASLWFDYSLLLHCYCNIIYCSVIHVNIWFVKFICVVFILLTSPWKLLSKGATCFRNSWKKCEKWIRNLINSNRQYIVLKWTPTWIKSNK